MANVIFSDIDSLFQSNPTTGDVLRTVDEEAIKNAIRNLIFTFRDERFFQPNLFSGVPESLFEPINPITADTIKLRIQTCLRRYEPRIEDLRVDVTAQPDQNHYFVRIVYIPKKSINEQSLTLFLQRAS